MAATAYQYKYDEAEERERTGLRLIPGGKPKPGRATAARSARASQSARHQDARPFRRVFTTVVVVCAALVVLGLGPVFLSAQATRDSQQSVLIQESLDAANARSEQLEMRRSVLTSSLRINTIATTQLGMVPATGGQMTVELDSAKPRVAAAPQEVPSQAPRRGRAGFGRIPGLSTLARLTAGQASALLVGDVGLAATR
ncbi:MAG: hypothetical protein FWD65_03120 [Coriobacteriia bacterium]|nr:hypothetical protein [Coriobacteriia bacterium]